MNIQITGRHLEVTEAIREHVEKEVSKFSKLVGGKCDFNFVLTVEKHRQIAEGTLSSKLGTITATGETKDLYLSIGEVVDKLDKQVRKSKEKRQDRNRVGPGKESMNDLEETVVTHIGHPDKMAENPVVIEAILDKKPMAVEEAIVELKESTGSFVVFINAKTNTVNVLYRRKDGNYGLIRP